MHFSSLTSFIRIWVLNATALKNPNHNTLGSGEVVKQKNMVIIFQNCRAV